MKRIAVIGMVLAICLLSLGTPGTAVAAESHAEIQPAQTRNIIFPGLGTWYVCQGYNTKEITHTGSLRYSLDLTTDPKSVATGNYGCNGDKSAASGQKLYAPAAGTVQYLKSRTDLINLKLNSGGCLQLGHLSARAPEGAIAQNDQIGVVASPNSLNGNYSHIHVSAFSDSSCSTPVAFEENSNFRIYGAANLPATTTAWAYRKTSITRSVPPVTNCNTPSGQFCGAYYSNRSLNGNPVFTQNTGSISYNWGSNGPGNGVGNDNFSVRWQGAFSFESANYLFKLTADDGIRLYVDSVLKSPTSPSQDPWRDQSPTTYQYQIPMSSGSHTIKVEYYENGGGAIADVSWAKIASSPNLARGRSTFSTSNQSSSYLSNMAVDGSTSTRWSSAQSSSLGPQWWIVDLGSSQSINQIVVRWEAAYAQSYFVGYSNASNCSVASYTGWNFYPASRTDNIISFSPVTARCVGIYMRTRAPGMNNYSIFEVEVYRK